MFFALLMQAIAIVSVTASSWLLMDATFAQAIGYGTVVALVNSGMLVRRWYVGLYDYHCDAPRHLKSFHRSSMERFFVVGILLALGLAVFKLMPSAMLLGFIVGQLAWIVANILARRLF
ncbi:MAG: hypothetical protein B7Y41_02450 [Hydrogenophilales bacterium 28-61-23]|nr:MAG: hypothetical protein B7Y41_02450 [Hydrogenophilales bacterium 28-61-23]